MLHRETLFKVETRTQNMQQHRKTLRRTRTVSCPNGTTFSSSAYRPYHQRESGRRRSVWDASTSRAVPSGHRKAPARHTASTAACQCRAAPWNDGRKQSNIQGSSSTANNCTLTPNDQYNTVKSLQYRVLITFYLHHDKRSPHVFKIKSTNSIQIHFYATAKNCLSTHLRGAIKKLLAWHSSVWNKIKMHSVPDKKGPL